MYDKYTNPQLEERNHTPEDAISWFLLAAMVTFSFALLYLIFSIANLIFSIAKMTMI